MSQIIPIYIPTYIGDQNYNPNRVLPRLFFYNGLVDCEEYYIESGSLTNSGIPKLQTAFPYFDNYNVVTGSFPTLNSDSLLFNNEAASYGQIPTGSLYTQYWETYVNLLYNPRTRLFNCEAIIPLAEYYKMELNDIVEWRGNYYHLRAINEYNLKNGECKIQLLGPLEPPVITNLLPIKDCGFNFTSSLFTTTTTTTTTAAPTVFYQATIGSGLTRTVSYTDYNNASRSATFDPSRSFRFAAISGSVSFNNPLGCTLTVLQQPFTPVFEQYQLFFGPTQLPTYYINWQDSGGAISKYTNYTYPTTPSTVCVVSGSFSGTGGLNWPVGFWRITNTGAC